MTLCFCFYSLSPPVSSLSSLAVFLLLLSPSLSLSLVCRPPSPTTNHYQGHSLTCLGGSLSLRNRKGNPRTREKEQEIQESKEKIKTSTKLYIQVIISIIKRAEERFSQLFGLSMHIHVCVVVASKTLQFIFVLGERPDKCHTICGSTTLVRLSNEHLLHEAGFKMLPQTTNTVGPFCRLIVCVCEGKGFEAISSI